MGPGQTLWAPPRPLLADRVLTPVLLFTDAASEGEAHTCGAVLLDPLSTTKEFFQCVIQPSLIDEWRVGDIRQIITHAELYPIFLARHVWKSSDNYQPHTGSTYTYQNR